MAMKKAFPDLRADRESAAGRRHFVTVGRGFLAANTVAAQLFVADQMNSAALHFTPRAQQLDRRLTSICE